MTLLKRDKLKKTCWEIEEIFQKEFPNATTALRFASPFELLIATILSAQCTDDRVNKVTTDLFKKYKTPGDYIKVEQGELEEDIRSTGFYHNKARAIQECCRTLVDKLKGNLPDKMEELIQLPGVGRKTANCVLGNVYHQPAIIVDTHVRRLVERLHLTRERDPDKIEFALQELLPTETWTHFSNSLTWHGRKYCTARKPKCDTCPISHLCPSANKVK